MLGVSVASALTASLLLHKESLATAAGSHERVPLLMDLLTASRFNALPAPASALTEGA